MTNTRPDTITVQCENCGATHVAEYSHDSTHGGHAVYESICPVDLLSDYFTELANLA